MIKAKRRKASSADLRESKVSFWTARSSLLFLLKSAKTSTSVGYRRMSYPTGIDSEKECSHWSRLGPLRFGDKRKNVTSVLTPGGLLFHAPWAERGFPNRMPFLLPGSMTVVALLEPSLRPLLRLRLLGGVAGGSPRSRRAGLVDPRLFVLRESARVVGRGLLFFLFLSVTIY